MTEYRVDSKIIHEVSKNPRQICVLGDAERSHTALLNAIAHDSSLIVEIDPNNITPTIAMQVFSHTCGDLSEIPISLRSRELCTFAIMRRVDNFLSVPEQYIDQDFVDLVFVNMGVGYHCVDCIDEFMAKIPKEFLHDWHYLKLAAADSGALRLVPPKLLTENLIFSAIAAYGIALKYVPETLITQAMCYEAVRSDPEVLKYVPDRFRDEHCYRLISGNSHRHLAW